MSKYLTWILQKDKAPELSQRENLLLTHPHFIKARYIEKGNANKNVAFYATLTKNQLLNGDKTVVYDKVYTNLGSGYNNKDGKFTAPEKGLYYFTSTLMALHNKDLHLFMMKNKNVIGYGHGSPGGADMGSVNAVIKLGKGDVVKMSHEARQGPQTIYGDGFCSFAGYLINNLSDKSSAEYVEIHLKSKLK